MRAPRTSSAKRSPSRSANVDRGRARRRRGGKFDGEGQAVESSTDAFDDGFGRTVGFVSRLDCTSTIHEELDGGRGCQPRYGYEDFAGNTEWLAAGGHDAKARYLSDQGVGEARSLVDNVFAVVEDDHERAAGEVAGDELGRRSGGLDVAQSGPHGSERAGGGWGDPFGIGDASQFDQPGAARVLFPQAGCGLDRQTGLAHSTGSDKCDQAAGGNRFAHLLQFGVSPEESA